MKVFKIEEDINNIKSLKQKVYNSDIINLFKAGKKLKPIFNPLNEKYITETKKYKILDFYHSHANLTLSEKAMTILGKCLELHGEIFPVEISNLPKGNNIVYLLNILTTINPYDTKESEWDEFSNGKKYWPKKIVFKKNKVTESIFIIPSGDKEYGYYPDFFCTDGLLPPEEEFYHIYQNSGLKGLRFKEIELT